MIPSHARPHVGPFSLRMITRKEPFAMKRTSQTDKTALFETMPVPKAVLTLAVPTVASILVTLLYSLADTWFVGLLNDPIQNAAVTPCRTSNAFASSTHTHLISDLSISRRAAQRQVSALFVDNGEFSGKIEVWNRNYTLCFPSACSRTRNASAPAWPRS